MALSILNNIPSLAAQNQLSITGSNLQKTLFRLSSGSRINSGADDAAGLAIADGLRANISALTQSARNATDGVGQLQVADGALGQVTNLLNRAVTLATESASSTVTDPQRTALNAEFVAIQEEIDSIGNKTTFNGQTIFTGSATVNDTNQWNSATGGLTAATSLTASKTFTITDTKTGNSKVYDTDTVTTVGALLTAIQNDAASGSIEVTAALVGGKIRITDSKGDGSIFVDTDDAAVLGGMAAATHSVGGSSVYLSDGGATTGGTIDTTIAALSKTAVGSSNTVDLTTLSLATAGSASTALSSITQAIANVAADRGKLGASINRLQAASNVINNQVQNLSAAEDGIRAADIAQEVANMTKFNILNQTGISALAQANQMQQGVLSLLR